MVCSLGPLLGRREAQAPGEKRSRVSEFRSEPRLVRLARASCGSAPGGEHRREAEGRHSRGRLFFGSFLLAKQKKGTRHQAKNTATYYPELEIDVKSISYPSSQIHHPRHLRQGSHPHQHPRNPILRQRVISLRQRRAPNLMQWRMVCDQLIQRRVQPQ